MENGFLLTLRMNCTMGRCKADKTVELVWTSHNGEELNLIYVKGTYFQGIKNFRTQGCFFLFLLWSCASIYLVENLIHALADFAEAQWFLRGWCKELRLFLHGQKCYCYGLWNIPLWTQTWLWWPSLREEIELNSCHLGPSCQKGSTSKVRHALFGHGVLKRQSKVQ